jgi:hypothetical protein
MDEPDSRGPSATATLSVPEAGRLLGLDRNASYEAARRGDLPVLEFGRKKRVPCVALQRMLAEARPRSSEKLEEA